MHLPLTLLPTRARPFDLVGLGQNSVDLVARVPGFPQANSKARLLGLDRLAGGQVATAMVCSARLGWRTRYIGRFGDDDAGEYGRASLDAEGVDISATETLPGVRSRTALILVDETTGERTVLWDRDPRLVWQPSEVPLEAVRSGRVLLVDAEDPLAAARVAAEARAADMVTVVDVEAVADGVEALLAEIEVMIVSEGFPQALTGTGETGRALAQLDERFRPAVACVTLGADGCLARCQGREWHVPAFPVTCVDSTGAGDAFRGGFIARLLGSVGRADLEDVLRYANAVAALNCRQPGARSGLPRQAEVESLMAPG